MSSGMYGLRTIVAVVQGVWYWLRNLVVVNGLALMWDLFCVDRSVFCNTFLVLCSAGGLVCDVGQSDMTSVWLHWLSVFVCVSAWFAFGVYWFKRYVCVFRVERDSSFFEGTRLATFPIVVMGFSALIHSQQLCAVVESIEFDRDIFRVSLNHKILCSFFFYHWENACKILNLHVEFQNYYSSP